MLTRHTPPVSHSSRRRNYHSTDCWPGDTDRWPQEFFLPSLVDASHRKIGSETVAVARHIRESGNWDAFVATTLQRQHLWDSKGTTNSNHRINSTPVCWWCWCCSIFIFLCLLRVGLFRFIILSLNVFKLLAGVRCAAVPRNMALYCVV